MARDDGWLMGALAAQDAYRGDADWPAPPVPSGAMLRTGSLPRSFEEYLAAATMPRQDDRGPVVPPAVSPAALYSPTMPTAKPAADIVRDYYAPKPQPAPERRLPGAEHYGPDPERERVGEFARGVRDALVNTVREPFEEYHRHMRGEYGGDLSRTTEGIIENVIPNLVGAASLGGRSLRGAVVGATGGSRMVQPTIPREAPGGALGSTFELPAEVAYPGYARGDVSKLQPRNISKYVDEPQRVSYPGIYKNPRVIAEEAAANVAPEHPAMKELFGVTRDDLWEIGGRGARPGNVDPASAIWQPTGSSGGSYVSDAIMKRRNAQRIIDTLGEAERYPELTRGMDAWYVMDPAFQQMVRLVGREQAIKDYTKMNATVTPFSSNSDVLKELNRGTGAHMMATRGEFPIFAELGGLKAKERPADFPEVMRDISPHLRHSGHVGPVGRYLETGSHGWNETTVKNPLYSLASGVPETGFQTRLPVPDAHFARAIGAADVRQSKAFDASMKGPEYRDTGPWFRENVAAPLGIEAVPAQARMWGVFAPQTGVKTAVGAPKLELLSQLIWERAQRLGIDPRVLRDQVLTGKGHAALVGGLGGTLGMGALADQSRYDYQ
jgi:hypothetical protein